MKYLPLTAVFLLFLSGCSTFSFSSNKKTTIPAKPTHQEPEFRTAQQQSADIIDQLADVAVFEGLSANSQGSQTLKEHSEVLTMVLGKPVEPIAWEDQDASKEVIKTLKALELEYRELYSEWENALDALRDKDAALMNMAREKSSLIGWLWTIGIALAVLCILFPGVGVPIVFSLIKRGKKLAEKAVEETSSMVSHQFGQLSDAIEEVQREHPEAYEKLKEKVHLKADAATRDALNQKARLL